jgi:hypothetical protein
MTQHIQTDPRKKGAEASLTAAPPLGRDLTELGLAWWGRRVRVSEGGARQCLYSLMAEGGLPDAYLADAARYRTAGLSLVAKIEKERALGEGQPVSSKSRRLRVPASISSHQRQHHASAETLRRLSFWRPAPVHDR